LPPGERILVVAPHPDDDVLGCGGLIQQALALGDSVRVVFLTCGDGSWSSAAVATARPFLGPRDYVAFGQRRMAEARAGAKALGMDSGQLTFLGYPDAGLAALWQEYWDRPFRSPNSDTTADPYGLTGHEYTGSQLLADLDSLLRSFRPGRVFVPHTLDAHNDHWATAAFLALAREVWARSDTGQFPDVYHYLIHHPPWPNDDPACPLLPPADLTGPNHRWYVRRLTDSQLTRKSTALECHVTQMEVVGDDLARRCRAEELFDIALADTGPVTEDAPGIRLVPASCIETLAVVTQRGRLKLRLVLGAGAMPEMTYGLYIHALGRDRDSLVQRLLAIDLPVGAGEKAVVTPALPDVRVALIPDGWGVELPPGWLPESAVVFYMADVKWGSALLNHSGLGRSALDR
jgi:LmbE family N-acetylglucosaminyl deacetylase